MMSPSLVAQSDRCVDVVISRAGHHDIDDLVELERASWPSGMSMRADPRRLAARIALGTMLIARAHSSSSVSGRIVGFVSTFRPRWVEAGTLDDVSSNCPSSILALPAWERWEALRRRYDLPASWHDATADGTLLDGAMHDARGDVVFGIGIATDPRERGKHIASTLLDAALRDAAASGARYFVGYGRLPQFHSSPLGLDEYMRLTRRSGGRLVPRDFGLRLHWALGAQPVRGDDGSLRYIGVPGSMPGDNESRGAGVLVVTPLRERAIMPFERCLLSGC